MDRNNFTTPEEKDATLFGFAEKDAARLVKTGLSLPLWQNCRCLSNCSFIRVLNRRRRRSAQWRSWSLSEILRHARAGQLPDQRNFSSANSTAQDGNPFINWMVKQVKENALGKLDICVGYARVQKLP